jgi:hypothetical protein
MNESPHAHREGLQHPRTVVLWERVQGTDDAVFHW